MTAGVTIVLILVGLPLLAWWVGGRAFWSRPRPGGDDDLHRTIVLRHGLRPAEIPQVEGALTWGRQLDEPHLRAAVVDWGRSCSGWRPSDGRTGPGPVAWPWA